MPQHHDTGYKELFSHPEFVQQLIEGFAPSALAALLDFATLRNHSGHYITPLFDERIEDVVWSVRLRPEPIGQLEPPEVFLFLLLEFQSTVDRALPIRLLHYVACFYDHLLKTKAATPGRGLPPVFPVVLYNGAARWTAKTDVYDLIRPEPPAVLRPYQPRLRYALVDEGRYADADLAARGTPLSAVFALENARTGPELRQALARAVAALRAHPDKARLDALVTRWFKRRLHRLAVPVADDELNSLVEDHSMLAENLENWIRKERQEGRQEGLQEGRQDGLREGLQAGHKKGCQDAAARILRKQLQLKFGPLPDWAEARLAVAPAEQLEAWAEALLVADDLAALLGAP